VQASRHPADGNRGYLAGIIPGCFSGTPCRGAAGSIGSCVGMLRGLVSTPAWDVAYESRCWRGPKETGERLGRTPLEGVCTRTSRSPPLSG
jgi:hypothetical protein